MKTYDELRKINVGEHIEKKNGLSYLSWSWAVDVLLQNDPSATWEFPEPKYYADETVMVYCDVTAFGKTMKMHLPVMDLRNKAISSPDSVEINKAMMRCLAKCIACFGLGLYIYSGEDLPTDSLVDDSLRQDTVEAHISEIGGAKTVDELQTLWQITIDACGDNLELKKRVNAVVRAKKAELEGAK